MKESISEANVKAEIKQKLKAAGFWFFFPVMGMGGVAGIPDIIGCSPKGRFFAIEAKGTGGIVSALQKKVLNDIRQRGGIAIVVWPHNLADVDILIEALK